MQSLTSLAYPRGLGGQAARIVRCHIWLIAAILIFAVCVQVIPRIYGLEDYIRMSLYVNRLPHMLAAYLITFAICHALYVMLVIRPQHLIEHVIRAYREEFLTFERLANGFLLILLLPLFFSVFTSFKIMVPRFNPFSWDQTFADWDRWLHGGVDPWRLLHGVFGFPEATVLINVVYHLWLFVLYAMLFWQAFSVANPKLRMQFLITTVLTWSLLGSLAATLFSSAGPCYFGLVTGLPDPFAPLMAYLQETSVNYPVPVLDVQALLWEDYLAGGIAQARGISAMPSMHVSSAFLFTLVGWRVDRRLGTLLTVFLLFIHIGSVHLGWHYAIDGYAAIPATWLLWYLTGKFLDLDPMFRRARPARRAAT